MDLDWRSLVIGALFVAAAAIALALHLRGWRADGKSFAGQVPAADPRGVGRRARWLRLTGLALLALSAAAPALRQVRADSGAEPTLVIVLDVSMSMHATDLAPSRLDEAKRQIADGLAAPGGGRVALVAFAAAPTLVCPPTTDRVAFADLLDATREDAATAGLSLAAPALARAAALAGGGDGDLVLVSDGEFPDEDRRQLQEVVGDAARRGLRVSTIGVGTREGAPVPVRGSTTGQVQTDDRGQPLPTRLDESVLQWLAEQGGGRYVALEPGGRLDLVAMTERLRLAGAGTPPRLNPFGPSSLFGYPLSIGIALLAIDAWRSWRRRRA